eukprot:5555310-Pyramimonas_sp.AAC.1
MRLNRDVAERDTLLSKERLAKRDMEEELQAVRASAAVAAAAMVERDDTHAARCADLQAKVRGRRVGNAECYAWVTPSVTRG